MNIISRIKNNFIFGKYYTLDELNEIFKYINLANSKGKLCLIEGGDEYNGMLRFCYDERAIEVLKAKMLNKGLILAGEDIAFKGNRHQSIVYVKRTNFINPLCSSTAILVC